MSLPFKLLKSDLKVNLRAVCRMVGFVAREPRPLRAVLVDAPRSLLWMSLHGRKAPHRHGFGYLWKTEEGGIVVCRYGYADLEKTPGGFPDPLEERSTLAIGHVRKASPEYDDYSAENAHPFVCDGIYLAHNGGIRDSEVLEYGPGIDSERLTRWLAHHWIPRIPDVLIRALSRLLDVTRSFSSFDFLMTDGRDLYAFCCFAPDRDTDYYALRLWEGRDIVIISSEEPDDGPGWGKLKSGELVRVTPELRVKRWLIP